MKPQHLTDNELMNESLSQLTQFDKIDLGQELARRWTDREAEHNEAVEELKEEIARMEDVLVDLERLSKS